MCIYNLQPDLLPVSQQTYVHTILAMWGVVIRQNSALQWAIGYGIRGKLVVAQKRQRIIKTLRPVERVLCHFPWYPGPMNVTKSRQKILLLKFA